MVRADACVGAREADFGPWLLRIHPPDGGRRGGGSVRDARPEGRDGAATAVSWRWRPGAVGNSRIVAYRARSPVRRLGAEHAQPPGRGRMAREETASPVPSSEKQKKPPG